MINSVLAAMISFTVVLLVTPKFIPFLMRLKMGQTIRELGPKTHYKKAGTPTMGGIVMMLGILVSCIVFSIKGSDGDLVFALFVCLVFGLTGFLDDYIKMVQKQRLKSDKGVLVPYLGMSPKQKLLLQFSIAGAIAVYAAYHPNIGTDIIIPFTNITFDLNMFFIPFAVITIVAVVNAANLTDGLDGLACGVTMIVLVFFLAASLVNGFSSMAIFASAVIGACLGFLVYNSYPASIFMGDTGSMALGGAVAIIALFTKTELFILIAGGIYFAEALSSMLQVGYFKMTKGKRLFKMAPIHHHFELCGMQETKIVIGFWIVTCILVLISMLSLPIMIS